MSEKHLEVVEAEFGMGPDCPTCRAKVTPQIAMDEHAPLCAEVAALSALIVEKEAAQERMAKDVREAVDRLKSAWPKKNAALFNRAINILDVASAPIPTKTAKAEGKP